MDFSLDDELRHAQPEEAGNFLAPQGVVKSSSIQARDQSSPKFQYLAS